MRGLEHGPADFFPNPPALDTGFQFRLAVEGRYSAIALGVGLRVLATSMEESAAQAVRDGFHCFRRALAQGVHLHHVAAPDVRQQRADGGGFVARGDDDEGAVGGARGLQLAGRRGVQGLQRARTGLGREALLKGGTPGRAHGLALFGVAGHPQQRV